MEGAPFKIPMLSFLIKLFSKKVCGGVGGEASDGFHAKEAKMQQIKARGIVLQEYDTGESDKRLVLLCKGHGRILAYARGARKPTSKFMAGAQLFTYADFVLTRGAGFHSLAQADVIENFFALRQDYDSFMAACHVSEICQKTLWDEINCDELLMLVLKTMQNLAKGKIPAAQAAAVFLFRFFGFQGLQPQMDACTICGTPAGEIERPRLVQDGLTCHHHPHNIHRQISPAAMEAISYIQKNDLPQSFSFSVQESALKELRQIAKFLWDCHFDIGLKTEL